MSQMVSVIIPTYRRFEPLLNTLATLLQQDYEDFELIVIDQNPEWPPSLRDRAADLKQDLRLRWLSLPSPGVVGARNEGVVRSIGDILLFVDDDVAIDDPHFIASHVINYQHPDISAVAGRELSPEQHQRNCTGEPPATSDRLTDLPGQWSPAPPLQQILSFGRSGATRCQVCTFSTCNGSIRRSAFFAVGGFDENYEGNSYGDDYDLALRLNSAGFRIIYDPRPALVHLRIPVGGLRLSDPNNIFSEKSKALCSCIFFLRYVERPLFFTLLYKHVLRKTVLLRRNITRPWRQFRAWAGLFAAFAEARRRVKKGPFSRLKSIANGSSVTRWNSLTPPDPSSSL